MGCDAEEGVTSGPARAARLIDELGRASNRDVAASFARIIIELFPEWFDFGADKFAVLAWDRGLHLIVSGSEYSFAFSSTSDSRCMSCKYLGPSVEQARMDMHYRPSAEQAERARTVIRLALHRLFPANGNLPEDLRGLVPEGRVFPPSWDEGIDVMGSSEQSPPTAKRPWWRIW
jgi:hypothetical protein